MAFSRRKGTGSDSTKRSRRGASRDPFEHLSEERAKAEEGEPWFLADDDDAPDLNVQAGISSNLRPEDLALLQEGVGSGPPSTPRDAVRRDRPPLDASSGPESGGGPGASDASLLDPGQGHGASVFPALDPEASSGSSDSEPLPTTGAFDGGSLGPLAQSVFEDTSRHTQAYGERSSGDTLAPPADELRPVFDEPGSDLPEVVASEPAEASVFEEVAPDTDIASAYTDSAASPSGYLDVASIPVEPEETEPEPVESDSLPLTSEPEELEPVDVAVEPNHLEPELVEGAGRTEPEDPDMTPPYDEPVAANSFDDLRSSPEVPAPEPAATSVFDLSEPDAAKEAEVPASTSEPRDEEPLRSALLQSFKDVVARAPASDFEGDGESLGLDTEDAPEPPEPANFHPRKPPSRPRRL